MNPANVKKAMLDQLNIADTNVYYSSAYTTSNFLEHILKKVKKKKPTRRKQTVKKVNGKAANQRIFARTWDMLR